MKNTLLLPSLLSIALLQACGGGGGDSDSASTTTPSTGTVAPPTTPTTANTGAVSTAFVAGATPRYQLTYAGGQSFAKLDTHVQNSSGAMTTLGSTVLGGVAVTKDISGDATYAMGRWVNGTVIRASGAETLTGADSRSHHYIVLNAPEAFPTSGAKTCDAGVFTTPTSVNDGNGASGTSATGTVNGSVSIAFGADGASVAGAIVVDVSGAKGSVPLQGKVTGVTANAISGAYLSNGAGAAIQIGDAGGNAYLVVASYAATLPNGARYIGVAKFRCA